MNLLVQEKKFPVWTCVSVLNDCGSACVAEVGLKKLTMLIKNKTRHLHERGFFGKTNGTTNELKSINPICRKVF